MHNDLRLRKLDRRFTAYQYFDHMVEVRSHLRPGTAVFMGVPFKEDHTNFFQIREWLWETYGPSKELKHWMMHQRQNKIEDTSHNPHWCWDTEYLQHRIYLSEEALTNFTLRWL